MPSLSRTLLLGLGTSGLRVLSELEKLTYASFGKNRLPFFRCLYVETNVSENPEKTPADSEITPVRLRAPNGLAETYQNLSRREDLDLDWLAEKISDQVPSSEQGAGGVRPAGRMLLWGENNFSDLYSAIQRAWEEIDQATRQPNEELQDIAARSGAPWDPLSPPMAFVVGSLVGGTGSGIFIDVGYVIQKITGNRHNLYGIFLLPREDDKLTFGFGNCYGALQEYDYFCMHHIQYPVKYPNETTLYPTEGKTPFTICYLASTAYGLPTLPPMNLTSLYKVVALRLFCELLGLAHWRGAELTDQVKANYGNFGGFGISAVMYPKYSVTEGAACRLGEQLCNRWLDPIIFFDSVGGERQISSGDLLNNARQFLDSCLARVFQALGAKGGAAASLDSDVERDADRIIRKLVTPAELLTEQFSQPKAGNYYSSVHENLPKARQILAEEIAKHLSSVMDERQNLTCADLLLRCMRDRVDETLKYWRNGLGVPNSASEWPNWITSQIEHLLARRNRSFLLHRITLIDRMRELLKLLKMFALADTLDKLKDGLEKGSFSYAGGSTIPSMSDINRFRRGMEKARGNLTSRYADIKGEVNDQSVPVMRLWRDGGFDQDVNALLQKFNNERANSKPRLTDVSDQNSFRLLEDNISKNNDDPKLLLEIIKPRYQASLYTAVSKGPFDAAAAARQQSGTTTTYARMATAGLLRLSGYTRPNMQGVPRFILGAKAEEMAELKRALEGAGCNEFTNTRTLPLLEDAVIFYDEQPGTRPLDQLLVHNRLSHHFENPDPGFQFGREVWKAHRLAYATDSEMPARRQRVRELMGFLLDFGICYEKDYYGHWKSLGSRWGWLRLHLGPTNRFQYKDSRGLDQTIALEPEQNSTVRSVAANEPYLRELEQAVRKAVQETDDKGFVDIFNSQLLPRLIDSNRTQSDIQKVQELYFGKAPAAGREDSKIKGFIVSIREENQKQTQGASTHAQGN